jgi:hypothetical protein
LKKSGLFGRRILISGSASRNTDPGLIVYAHDLLQLITSGILEEGGGLVLSVGKEPFHSAAPEAPSLIFDWTALEAVQRSLKSASTPWPVTSGPMLVIATSEKAVSEIPTNRLALWNELVESACLNVEYILPGSRSGALIRDRQAQLADALLAVGGGSGVEHLAELMLSKRSPVIPIDLQLGASREDGTGGAAKLALEARRDPNVFFRLQSEYGATTGAAFESLSTRNGTADKMVVARNTVDFLKRLSLPTAFYTRLMDPRVDSYQQVETFFRHVVDTVVEELGYNRHEVGFDMSKQAFINNAIFENLHYSSVAIVDLTGDRNNCYMELGYAFGKQIKVIMTAKEGTALPFDPKAIPCHFWKPGIAIEESRNLLKEFWRKNIDRLPLVP